MKKQRTEKPQGDEVQGLQQAMGELAAARLLAREQEGSLRESLRKLGGKQIVLTGKSIQRRWFDRWVSDTRSFRNARGTFSRDPLDHTFSRHGKLVVAVRIGKETYRFVCNELEVFEQVHRARVKS